MSQDVLHQATAISTAPNNYGVAENPSKCEKHSGWSLCTCFHLWCSTNSKRGGQKLRKKLGSRIEVTAEPWDLTVIKQHWLLLYCKQTQKS